MSDPRRPAIPIDHEEDPDHVLIDSEMNTRKADILYYSNEDVGRIREGYCCIHCGESQVGHEGPMPERCWLCNYEMRAKQAERFAKEFKGNVRLGPSTSLEDERAIAEEYVRYQEMKRKGILPSGIVIPRGVTV